MKNWANKSKIWFLNQTDTIDTIYCVKDMIHVLIVYSTSKI